MRLPYGGGNTRCPSADGKADCRIGTDRPWQTVGFVLLVTVVVLLLTLVCVGTTMTEVVSERRREIGLKKALGATNRNIAGEFFGESCMLGFIGGIIGTGCGYLLLLPSESMFLAGVLKFHFPSRL